MPVGDDLVALSEAPRRAIPHPASSNVVVRSSSIRVRTVVSEHEAGVSCG